MFAAGTGRSADLDRHDGGPRFVRPVARKRQPDRRVADDSVVPGVVVGHPHARKLRRVRLLAELDFFQFAAQDGGQLAIAFVEVLQGQTDRFPFHELAQRALESSELRPGLIPHKRRREGPLDVADHGQRAALRVAEQPLGQASDERVGRELGSRCRAAGEVVEPRRAGAEAGEVEGDHPQQPGVVAHVLGCQVVIVGDLLLPDEGSGPVAAEKGAAVWHLTLLQIVGREVHAVAFSKEQGRGLRAPKQLHQPCLPGVCRRHSFHRPVRPDPGHLLRQGPHQQFGALRGRRIIQVLHAEEAGPARQGYLPGFDQRHAAGVLRVLLQRFEVDAPHRVLHVELILEAIRDHLRVADDQQVVGDLVGVGWTRPDALACQPCGFRLSWPRALSPIYSR